MVEPHRTYFDPFIKPLVEKPDSTYQYFPFKRSLDRGFWRQHDRILQDAGVQLPPELPPDDPRLRQLNPDVLIVGNLARNVITSRTVSYRTPQVSISAYVLHHMIHEVLANSGLQRGGLVRMLWWLPETEKYTLFPITEMFRKSSDVRLASACQTTEVVGMLDLYNLKNQFYARRRQRPPHLEAQLAQRVQQRMVESGMTRPAGRSFLHERPDASRVSTIRSPLHSHVASVEDLEKEILAAEARLANVKLLKSLRGTNRGGEVERELDASLRYPQCAEQVEAMDMRHSLRALSLRAYLDMNLRIVELEVGYKILEERHGADDSIMEGLRKRIMEVEAGFHSHLQTRTRDYYEFTLQMTEQQLACLVEPPLIQLDARSYEPLKGNPYDFYPAQEMMLLDMVPKPVDLAVPDLATRAESSYLAESLLKHILFAPSAFLADALDKIAPNAAQDLLPQIPAATDPRLGGRLNVKKLRARLISSPILEGLVKAWMEWPFKPSAAELELGAEEVGAPPNAEVDASPIDVVED